MSLIPDSLSNSMNKLPAKRSEFINNVNKFIVDNNIVGTAAGVSIALVTKDAIQSLVKDIIIPGIIFLLLKLNIQSITRVLPGNETFQISNFIKEFISWLFVVIITFVFVRFAFEGILGIDEKDINQNSEKNTTNQTSVNAAAIHKEGFYWK